MIKAVRIIKKRNIFYFLFFIFLFFTCSYAQIDFAYHPELKWQTIETEHFRVHYHQGTARTANLVAQIAEEIYPHITGLYQYEPPDKTDFIIRDTDDYANGGAYFFDNKVEIWSENLDYILRGTHNWLRDVVTHEFTHIISMGKALKFGQHVPAGWFQIFGYEEERRNDVVRGFPDVLVSYPVLGVTVPAWFAEGVAQFQSNSKRYDYRDSHREMILRDRVMTHHLLDLKQMGVFGKNSIGNESSYNQGFAFVKFLAKTFGDSILKDLVHQASSPLTITFEGVMEKVTGLPADSLYQQWKKYLEDTYSHRLKVIQQHLKTGQPIEDEGIGNIHPIFSPDGTKLAYIEGKSDYLSVNTLIVKNLKTGKKRTLVGPISSSLSWSPDGRFLVYSRHIASPPYYNYFNDIFIYDTKRHREFRITRRMRARNPDWSHDGKRIAYVVHSDGITNLFIQELEELIYLKKKEKWQTWYYDLNKHHLVPNIPPEYKKNWELYYRKVEFWGKGIQQLTHFTNGRQIYHPRWSPDDQYLIFDTSIDYGRDIARITANGGEFQFILNAPYDERYPVFSPEGDEIFFACDKTGIFNIYSYNLKTGEMQAHTNVIGGAFMPTVNQKNDLVYSLYINQGYKIYQIKKINELPAEHLEYLENYESQIPRITADGSHVNLLPARPYSRRFGPVAVWPRFLLDYGTIKPGFYVSSTEILDQMLFFGGFDVNAAREYNLFSLFEFRLWRPAKILLNFYNQTAKVEDDYFDPDSFTVSSDKIKVNFNLMEVEVGLTTRFRNYLDVKLLYSYSLYRAKIGTFAFRELANPDQIIVSPNIRYTYLKGHSLSLSLKRQKVFPEIDRTVELIRVKVIISFSNIRENGTNFLMILLPIGLLVWKFLRNIITIVLNLT